MMKIYTTDDGTVTKYVHTDRSETTVKTTNCDGSKRNKFNIFASCSSGCFVNCKFCHLTAAHFGMRKIKALNIRDNVFSAVKDILEKQPELSSVPVNLSWMGMGDFFQDINYHAATTSIIIDNLSAKFKYIEGVDIATTLPCINFSANDILVFIDSFLKLLNNLTDKPEGRSDLRIFYSLHSLDNDVRKQLIPRTLDLDLALFFLSRLNYNIIYHYMFLDGINDKHTDVERLLTFGENHNLRILRYNPHPALSYKESSKFDEIIDKLSSRISIKVQDSPGHEVKASCGMFMME